MATATKQSKINLELSMGEVISLQKSIYESLTDDNIYISHRDNLLKIQTALDAFYNYHTDGYNDTDLSN